MATKQIGTTGRDYSTMALYSSYLNALTLSAPEVGDCYNDATIADTSAVTFGGWTGGSATNTVTIGAASGQGFKDNANAQTNALKWNQSNGVALSNASGYLSVAYSISGSWVTLQDLQLKGTGTLAGALDVSGSTCSIYRNIIYGSLQNNYSRALNLTGSSIVVDDNLIVVTSGAGVGLRFADSTISKNTVIGFSNSSTGMQIHSYASSSVVKGNTVFGFSTDYVNTVSSSSDYNATDKGSFGGTNFNGGGHGVVSVTSAAFVSVTNGSEDLRIPTGSVLKDAGTAVGLTTDIVGTSRPSGSAYDIGCWEFVAAATTLGKLVMARQAVNRASTY